MTDVLIRAKKDKFKKRKNESFEDYRERLWKDYRIGVDIIHKQEG